ncbi:MAG: MIP/aquaporin family protein, partial [Fusobacteriaceae bacterium]
MNIYLAEFIGTLILILLGNGVVANVVLSKSKGNGSGWIVITAGWGFAVMVGAYSVGWISGAHLNPALTIGFAVAGLFDWALVPGYVTAQILGAMIGSLLVYLSYKNHYDETTDKVAILATFSTIPAIRNLKWNFVTEVIGTTLLVFGLLAIGNSNNQGMTILSTTGENSMTGMIGILGPLLAGFFIWSLGLSLGGPTGYAINPARDLGPRILHSILPIKNKGDSDWGYALVPILGPITGGIIGALLYV